MDSRFLKKDELVCSGESLAFEGYLVEIGEEEGDHKPVAHSTLQGKTFTLVGKTDIADHQARIPTNKKFSAGMSSPAHLIVPHWGKIHCYFYSV